MIRERDQPRMAAPIILGAGNIISGVTGLLSLDDRVAAYTYAAQFMPLRDWWISFIALGALILLGPLSSRIALITSTIAFGWWLMWTDFIWQAHMRLIVDGHHIVSLRGVWSTTWMAVIMLLLSPYLRRAKPVMSRTPGG